MKYNLVLAYGLLNRSQKRALLLLLLLMILVAILETAGIGLLLPLIGIVNSPALITENTYLAKLYEISGLSSPNNFIVVSTLFLIVLFFVKNAVFGFQSYIQSRILLNIQVSIEKRLLVSYYNKDYIFFTQTNSADLVQSIRNVSGVIGLIFLPVLTALTELVVLSFVFLLLVVAQPLVTILASALSVVLLSSIFRFTRSRATRYGAEGGESMVQMAKWMYQGFGGVKEVKILSREQFFIDQCIKYSRDAAWSGMKGNMLSSLTRPVIETVWFSLTMMLVLSALLLGSFGEYLLPTIALFAAAAIRVMPALNRILNATISVRQGTYHVESVVKELEVYSEICEPQPQPSSGSFFNDCIQFENVAFDYPGGAGPVLKSVSFEITKGESVAFVGPSGAGKTTVVDLLLGLLVAKGGRILIDGIELSPKMSKQWRSNFGYVPQSIYLADDSIRNNIAFGQLPEHINSERIRDVVKQSQLEQMLARLPQGLDTVVGDRGARLSGGQRQRIGIARALYRDPPILVLDEATSALDNETEREVSRSLNALQGVKTVVLIAHRLSTVKHCDKIIFLVDGAVSATGTYEQLMLHSSAFRSFATAAPH